MDHPRPGLKYVDAGDLDKGAYDLDGIDVVDPQGEKLGAVDGFIIDVNSGRPFHVVVEAGHWYKHRHFLLPIGHVRLDAGSKRLTADVARQRAERFPGFSRGEFESLTDQDIDQMAYTTASACGDDAIDRSVSWASWTHYEYPSWWDASYDRPDRADIEARNIGGASATGAMASGGNASAAAGYDT
ncbi:MAG TPA: PRC-barrel domain-containing protein, partial [Vicinamibacterales bacterium]|nr:PRC-barrel domain-containing protein [Vicinamibacterales bacterium]